MNYLRLGAILAVICCMHTSAFAQMRGWELGGWVGASNYFGDLNTNWRLNRLHLHGGIGARYNFNDRLAFKLGINAGGLSASDSDSKNVYEQRRNLDFKSLLFDGTAQFEFNFLPYVHGDRELWYTPYLFLGTSFYYFNPQTDYEGQTYNLRELGTEGQFHGEEYNTTQGAIAYGFGFKTDLGYRWSINVELSGRKLFTDYLDDVSTTYIDASLFDNYFDEENAAVAKQIFNKSDEIDPDNAYGEKDIRGNPKHNDFYYSFNLKFSYRLSKLK